YSEEQINPWINFQPLGWISFAPLVTTIIRDKGFVAGGCAITTYINGKYLAELDTGEKVTAFLNPGDVLVGAGFAGKGLCNGAPKKEREFSIKENDPRALRIFIDQSGNVDILPMSIN
ncbi:hypothetical protein POV94_23540, partial [Enterobacter roggenkampii]